QLTEGLEFPDFIIAFEAVEEVLKGDPFLARPLEGPQARLVDGHLAEPKLQAPARARPPAGAQPRKLRLDPEPVQPTHHRSDRHRQVVSGLRLRGARLPSWVQRRLLAAA